MIYANTTDRKNTPTAVRSLQALLYENKPGSKSCPPDTVPPSKTQPQPRVWGHGAPHSSVPLLPSSRESRAGTAGTLRGAPSTKRTRTELQRAWRRTVQTLPCYRCISVHRVCARFGQQTEKKPKASRTSVPRPLTRSRQTRVARSCISTYPHMRNQFQCGTHIASGLHNPSILIGGNFSKMSCRSNNYLQKQQITLSSKDFCL
ncbi:uncharacterized protein LOC121109191 [Gallus gallus]|uniref:uncharacterized protein LOC121109191 n=1 Tax=Gallus gallus TaxID=9031 RepID=UPI001AE1F7B4|nr:uncharacterized protein LOC121109191 [Gallus gallus]